MEKRIRIRHCLPLVLAWVGACAEPPSQVDSESRTSAIVQSWTGGLMPFGGKDGTCIAVVGSGVQVATNCNPLTNSAFTISDGALVTPSGQCLDVQDGDAAAGVVDVTACNGTASQQWLIADGEVWSFSERGQSYCLDVHLGNHTVGTQIDVAPCNGTAAQAFWPTGIELNMQSDLSFDSWMTCECLDVLFDREQPGTTLDDSQCNGTNAQWFVLDATHHVRLANNQTLCVGFSGPVQNGLAPIGLETCNSWDLSQQWCFINASRPGYGGFEVGGVNIANMASGCLDIAGGNSSNATPVDDYSCNGTPAQLWFPSPGKQLACG